MGHGEHDMEIAGSQKFACPCGQPASASLCLALGAVAISARVVRGGLITAARALIAMATQGSGATALNGTQGFELLEVKARSGPLHKHKLYLPTAITKSTFTSFGTFTVPPAALMGCMPKSVCLILACPK